MIYDYLEAEKNDVLDYIKENIDFSSFEDIEELEEELNLVGQHERRSA